MIPSQTALQVSRSISRCRGIKDGDHLAGTSGEQDSSLFTDGEWSLVTFADVVVVLNGSRHGHEQSGSQPSPSAAYPSSAPKSVAVAIE